METAEDADSTVATLTGPNVILDLTRGDEGAAGGLGTVDNSAHLRRGELGCSRTVGNGETSVMK